jgi:hypothetical protein
MSNMVSSELGHRHYQHPNRDIFFFNRNLDNFSIIVIYLSLISVAERSDLWKRFHDENLIFTRPDFVNPSQSTLFADVKRIGKTHKMLVELLETACRSAPTSTPVLSELVTPTSKLPSWMIAPAGVVISTKTREVIPGQALSGASSTNVVAPATMTVPPSGNPGRSQATPTQSQTTQSLLSNTSTVPVSTTAGIDWHWVCGNALATAWRFGFVGVLFAVFWFPLLNGAYRDLRLRDVSEAATITTFIVGSLGFGLFKAVNRAKASSSIMASSQMPAVSHYYPSPSPINPITSPLQYPSTPTPARYSTPTTVRPPLPIASPPLSVSASSRYSYSRTVQSVAVVGSRARQIYHRPSCAWALKISGRNIVSFASIGDAQRAGYRRCNVCLP